MPGTSLTSTGAGSAVCSGDIIAGNGVIAMAADTVSFAGAIGTVSITVNRATGKTGAIGCTVTSANGTALAGVDFVAVNATTTFAAGVMTATVALALLGALLAAPKTLTLTLSAPSGGAALGRPKTCTVTLTPPV